MRQKLTVIAVLVLLVLLSVLYVGLDQGGPAETPEGPLHLIVEFLSGNTSAFDFLLTNITPLLASGDTIDLYDLTQGRLAVSAAQLDQEAGQLKAALPPGVGFDANTGFIDNVQSLADEISGTFTSIGATYEPDGVTAPGTYNFSTCLAYFQALTQIAYGAGVASMAYPTGDPLLTPSLQPYGWNYGEIAATVDFETIETQRYALQAINDSGIWSVALQTLVSQFHGAGQPLSKLYVQVSLGNDNHDTGTDPAVALRAIQMAQAAGIDNVYLWTGLGYSSWLEEVIAGLNRTAGGPEPLLAMPAAEYRPGWGPGGGPWMTAESGSGMSLRRGRGDARHRAALPEELAAVRAGLSRLSQRPAGARPAR
jgi:hypothetical protein